MAKPIYSRDIMVPLKLNPVLEVRKSNRENAVWKYLKYNIVEGENWNDY